MNSKKLITLLVLATLIMALVPTTTLVAAPEAPVNLGSAGDFAILSKAGITNVPTSDITGDVGTSPITGAAIGLLSSEVTGTIYTVDAAGPPGSVTDPVLLTAAIGDMELAYTDAAGRPAGVGPFLNVGGGTLSGQTLVPGVYTWGSAVTITGDIYLNGNSTDVWIFQIAGTLNIAADMEVILLGRAKAKNIFWAVSGATTLGTNSIFEGNILTTATSYIALQTGAVLNGRALSDEAVTLQQNTITMPPTDATVPTVSSTIPVNGATGVAVDSVMSATFSEAMDPSTITDTTFTLADGATPVSGTVTYVGVTATFEPDDPLTSSTLYTATITRGAEDLAGNPLASNYVWTFTTVAAASTAITMNAPTGKHAAALPELRKGSKIEITGGGVTAGATVNVYWDDAFKESFTEGSGKLNSTKAKANGSFLVWLTIPEALNTTHYLWLKDVATGDTIGGLSEPNSDINLVPYLKLSPDNGLPSDTITLTGYHYGEEVDITAITDNFVDSYPSPLEATETPATPETSDLGTFTCTFKIPSATAYGTYTITAANTWDSDTVSIAVGAAITLNVEEGPVGKIVQISGRGFTSTRLIETAGVTIENATYTENCYVVNGPITVKADGTFKASIVIPKIMKLADDYEIIVVESGASPKTAAADFEVVGLAEIKATPAYGPQGSQITVEGWNFTQISNTEVVVTLEGVGSKTFKTDSKGYFKGTYTIPAVAAGVRELLAVQSDHNIEANANFRAGLMIVILSPDSGPAGTLVTVTGTGFTTSASEQWNATFGDKSWVDDTTLNADGTLSAEVYVPTIAPGTYTVTVLDIKADIEVTASFTVTKTTNVTPDPTVAPNNYVVKLKGTFFAADDDELEDVTLDWVLWNSTSNWDMDVYNNTAQTIDDYVWDTGNFTAYWKVPDDDVLDLGTYYVNVTDSEDLFYQFQFEVVSKTTEIAARKSTFRIGETLAFNVESSFVQGNSYIEIEDPSGSLYWTTDPFVAGNWLKVGTLEIYPFYQQTAGGNPMVLLEDAPLGTYTWVWYDDGDDELDSGTFMVAAATESVLGEQIEDLNTAVTDLQSDITTVSTEVAAVRTQITNVINAANAAVQAANAATQAVNAVAQTASAASTAAANAANAATEAKNAANGLTTLVYGAIGASLVAALAAIVSLMQISRRIAG